MLLSTFKFKGDNWLKSKFVLSTLGWQLKHSLNESPAKCIGTVKIQWDPRRIEEETQNIGRGLRKSGVTKAKILCDGGKQNNELLKCYREIDQMNYKILVYVIYLEVIHPNESHFIGIIWAKVRLYLVKEGAWKWIMNID